MRVTRLEIFGFKSFVERFVLNFDHNMLGIVGPNGCGKSNVVDALRWVLGETHAKHLRGTVLDDLIFNGSESRRPLGMAEVSITIRPSEGWTAHVEKPITLDSLDGNVKADGVDAGEGSGESEVSSEVAEAQSSEEPFPLAEGEDDASLLLQQAEKEAKRAEEQAVEVRPAIFSEIPSLLNAAEIQFTRRLYRSGESEYFINRVPCRLRDMTDIYRLIGLGARGLSIVQQGEIGQLISKKPTERRELLEEAAGISGFRTRMEAAQRKLEKTAENMARLTDIIIEVEKQVRVLQRQAKRARERNELKAELKQYELDLFTARSAKIILERREQIQVAERLDSELDRVRSELSLREANQVELQAELEGFEVKLSDRRRERDALQHTIQVERNRLNERKLELAMISGRIESLGKNLVRSDEAGVQLREELGTREEQIISYRTQVDETEARKVEAEQKLVEIQQREESRREAQQISMTERLEGHENAELLAEINRLQLELELMPEIETSIRELENSVRENTRIVRTQADEIQKRKIRLASIESEVNSLNAQLEALAEQVVKSTNSRGAQEVGQGAEGLNKVLLAGIRVPESFQRAVGAVLGDRAQYLITSTAAKLGENYASRGSKDDRTRFGIIDQAYIFENSTTPLSGEERALAPSAQPLLDRVEVEPEFTGVVRAFLGEFFVVAHLTEALHVNEANKAAGRPLRTFVTVEGEIVAPWGWCSTEGKAKSFSFTRRIAEQQELLKGEREELTQVEVELEKAEQTLSESRKSLVDAQARRERLFGVQKRVMLLRKEEQELERRLREELLQEERKRREVAISEEREAQAELRRVVSELANNRSRVEFENRKLEEIRREISKTEQQINSTRAEQQALEEKYRTLQEELETGSQVDGMRLEEVEEKCRLVEDTVRNIDNEKEPIKLQLAEVSEHVGQLRRELNQFQDQQGKIQLQLEKHGLELQMIGEEICRQYPETEAVTDVTIEAFLARPGMKATGENLTEFIGETQEDASKLRRRMEREGEVDPQSIELYEQEDARLQSMRTQFTDLQDATTILERTIRQLKEISRTRFLHTFKEVSEKFSELIPRLFGGGAGHLQLLNPDDPLASGVEMFVRPPGKKITNMELMSGGEKALVAVGVLLSMFLHRPSPICVLDEVDAPLDEANLERYLSLITEISAKTQFLIITHNKRSMAQANRLVGITMQEKGVSTALSVTLDESEAQIDKWIANA